jgi:succinyl-CoA synthetase beta subunit
LNIHEYQAKELFGQYQIPVPKGVMVESVAEAENMIKTNPLFQGASGQVFAVKAQIHAGGRGKAGGVKITKEFSNIPEIVSGLLGKVLVTHQTGPEGRQVGKVWIEQGSRIDKEFYLGMVVDRNLRRVTLIASTEGGMEIEEVAQKHPERIFHLSVDPCEGYSPHIGRRLFYFLGLPAETQTSFVKLVGDLVRFFHEKDASMVEINPLVLTAEKTLIALDAKVGFDDNAIYRQPITKVLRDLAEENPLEIEASKYNLNYVKLDGNIACMVNGAGLAMATMDVIALAGGSPANFLDVGGGASKDTVEQAFRLILSDPHVKGIFVNIFGGIVRCERIAGGIIAAAQDVKINVPLVVRLQGTNASEGREMLRTSGLAIEVAEELFEGAEKIVLAVKKGGK